MKKKKIIIISSILVLSAGIATYTLLISKKQPVTICKKPVASSPASNTTSNTSAPSIPNTNVPEPSSSTNTPINIVGNSNGNILNNGYAAEQGDWVYFKCNGLCKAMLDMKTGWTKLCDGNPENINVIGDWIYYSDLADNTVYKIKTDGTNKTLLFNYYVENLIATTDYLYYIKNDDAHLYRYDIKQNTSTKLSDDICTNFFLVDGWIYYANYSQMDYNYPKEFIKLKIDGSNKTPVIKDMQFLPTFLHNGYLYNETCQPFNMIKTKLNGTNPTELNESNLKPINILFSNDYIWIFDLSLNIYRVNYDNLSSTLICNISKYTNDTLIRLISIDDYLLLFDSSNVYKINNDGTIEVIS